MKTRGLFLLSKPATEYIFETSMISEISIFGIIEANALASIVLPDHGGHSIRILCQPEAAIRRALFACSCHITDSKSIPSNILLAPMRSSISIGLIISGLRLLSKISTICAKSGTGIIFIPGIRLASSLFSIGMKIFLNHFSLAKITDGRIEVIGRSLPSKANSHKNIDSFRNFELNHISAPNIHIAIERSKLGHFFFMSAGARLTVILVQGKKNPEFIIAVLTLSLLSWMAVSGSQTIMKSGIPEATSTSTSIPVHSNQFMETECIFVNIKYY
jgi:hypothetical protein